jgi:iron complex transport system ATP-binding protein
VTALALAKVALVRDGRQVLHAIDWQVESAQRWVVMGLNGSGKTTLIRIASLYLHPTKGVVEVLGERLGRTDVRQLRRRIGVTSAGFADLLRPDVTALDVVMTAKFAALEPWWHTYDDVDRDRAAALLEQTRVGHVQGQSFGTLSSGERQRVLLARTLMSRPELLLLDEPTAGLDFAGREELVHSLTDLAVDPASAPMVVVTHHVEEIPPHFTHALLLRDGAIHAAGPLPDVLTSESLSDCFGLRLEVRRGATGRWSAFSEPFE